MTAYKNILIVEDEAFIGMHIKMLLEEKGYIVSLVASGEKAIDYAIKNKPDLVIMDIQLSQKTNGIETAKTINQHITTRYIFITGYDKNNCEKEIEPLEPLALLIKPIDMDELFQVLNT